MTNAHAGQRPSKHRFRTGDAIFAFKQAAGWPLWRRWVIANAFGELLGLGIVAVLGMLASRLFGTDPHGGAAIAFAGAIVALGVLEGWVVGTAQWFALRSSLPAMEARAWIRATCLGAGVAWMLGMLPSTIMSLAPVASTAAAHAGPGMGTRHVAAVVMGLVGGPILAAFQWRVLRRHVPNAGWWLPANAIAWAVAMPIVFALAHVAAGDDRALPLVFVAVLYLAATGAVVGSIHGAVLVALVRSRRVAPGASSPISAPVVVS